MKIWRVLHAGYLIEYKGFRILFDPIFETPFSVNCHSFPQVSFDYSTIQNLNCDAIFISHYHEDHCSLESLNYLNRDIPIYMFCRHPEIFELLRELRFLNLQSVELDQAIEIGDLQIRPHRALDEDVDCIYEIRAGDIRVLNVVDSWIDLEKEEKLAKIKWDLILWPFQTMRELEILSPGPELKKQPEIPQEWLRQIQKLNPKYLVPSSCQFKMEKESWYNSYFFPISYDFFEKTIQNLPTKIQILKMAPGNGFELIKKNNEEINALPLTALSWIQLLEDSGADYKFDPTRSVPSTSEIAQNFPELTKADLDFVMNFLEREIFERFAQLDPDLCPLFFKKRTWKLCVFCQDGSQRDFQYTVKNAELSDSNTKNHDWVTEISSYKLFKILTDGESLTSAYIRIRPEFEILELQDLMQDPLLRVLYEGKFASYQRAQLRRLNL